MRNELDLWFDPAKCLINGEWTAPSGGGTLPLFDPSTGEEIGAIARGTSEDIDAAVAAAEAARHGVWGKTSAVERGRILFKLRELVLEKVEDLARIEAIDVGKPLKQARADAVALARYLEFYGGAADKLHGETIPYLDGYTVYALREPHGVTGHIVPWNYPMQIIGRSIGAALATGNACVLKPAEDACLTALAFADLAKAAGLPDGVLNVVPGLGSEAGAALSSHPGIHHVSFTGSVATGVHIQTAAATNVIPVTLELGGKSPQLVFDDADLDAALPAELVVVDVVEAGPGSLADRLEASEWQIELRGCRAPDARAAVEDLLSRDVVEVTRMTKKGPRTFDVRGALLVAEVSPEDAASDPAGPPCAILRVVVRHTTPAVRPDDVLTALDAASGFTPPVPPLVTRLAQGPWVADDARVADPLSPDREAVGA